MVYGIAKISADFVYDRWRTLSAPQSEQYGMWLHLAPDTSMVGRLKFFRVDAAYRLSTPLPAHALIGRRLRHKFWHAVPDYGAALFDSLEDLPPWCSEMPTVAVALPYAFSKLVACGSLTSFGLLRDWPIAEVDRLEPVFDADTSVMEVIHERLEPRSCRAVADRLRGVANQLGSAGVEAQDALYHCRSVLDNNADFHDLRTSGRPTTDRDKLIYQVLLADILRSDAEMTSAMTFAVRILLPPDEAQVAEAALRQGPVVLDRGSLSRSRFILDSAWSLFWRDDHARALDKPGGAAWYLMTDSSPQFDRDYQVTLLRRISKDALPDMMHAADVLSSMWSLRGGGHQSVRE